LRGWSIFMFDNLSDKLQRVFKNLRGEGKLSAENMESALREIRMALLEADVNFKVVKQLIESIKQKAVGEEVLNALSPSQQVVKIVHEELIKILGSHESKLRFANEPPSVILIVGLQGSGKTTSTGKLAPHAAPAPRADSVFLSRRDMFEHALGARCSVRQATCISPSITSLGEESIDVRRYADQTDMTPGARRRKVRFQTGHPPCKSVSASKSSTTAPNPRR